MCRFIEALVNIAFFPVIHPTHHQENLSFSFQQQYHSALTVCCCYLFSSAVYLVGVWVNNIFITATFNVVERKGKEISATYIQYKISCEMNEMSAGYCC